MAQRTREQLQDIVDDIYQLLQSTPDEIARLFGESRVKDDHARVNYALELLADYVSDPTFNSARKQT